MTEAEVKRKIAKDQETFEDLLQVSSGKYQIPVTLSGPGPVKKVNIGGKVVDQCQLDLAWHVQACREALASRDKSKKPEQAITDTLLTAIRNR